MHGNRFRGFALPTLLLAALSAAPLSARSPSDRITELRSRDHRITLNEALLLVGRFGERHPDAVRAGMFHRKAFEQLLAQPGAAGIRVQYAEHADGRPTFVLVGVDARGKALESGVVIDKSYPCPNYCGFAGLTALSGGSPLSSEFAEAPRDHRISFEEGEALVDRYRARRPGAIRSVAFNRGIFEKILAQPEAAGIRIYYAEHADGAPTLVLVGVDGQGSDLLTGTIGDNGLICPTSCN